MNKKSILKKMFQFSFFTAISKLLGFPREILLAKYLGVGALSDAFISAIKLPNLLRRIFAEGALSAAFIPTFVQLKKNKQDNVANGLMTISFLFFEAIVLLICAIVFIWPNIIIKIATPGFSLEQTKYTIPLLRILFPLLFFISSNALFAGSLQSVNHFFAQAFGPALHNIVYVSTLLICLTYQRSTTFLALGILLGGFFNFIFHLSLYLKHNLKFGVISPAAIKSFKIVISKFIPCLFGVGVVELNLFLDNQISSFLHEGAYTLLYYGTRFMTIPLGIFAVALSTVLLPHFSRLALYAPKRLNFYLLESAKFVSWVVIPPTMFLAFVSDKIFTQLLKNPANAKEATAILIIYTSGLVFFCLNKVLINIFYALQDTWYPTIATIIATIINFIFNIIGMLLFGSLGIAASTSISGIALTIMCIFYLYKKHSFHFYTADYFLFLSKYFIQLIIGTLFFGTFYSILYSMFAKTSFSLFFCVQWGYWLFTIPLFLTTMLFMFYIRKLCKIHVYFLDK